MAAFQVVTWNTAKGANKRVDSSKEVFDFLSVRVGADQLPIAQVGSGSSAAFGFGNRKLSNVADPSSAQDAATKNFVEQLFQTADGASNQALADAEARITTAYQAADQQISANASSNLDQAVQSLNETITDGNNAVAFQAQQALNTAVSDLTAAFEAADSAAATAAQQALADAQAALTSAYEAADAAAAQVAQQDIANAVSDLTSAYQAADSTVASDAAQALAQAVQDLTTAYQAADQSSAAAAQQAIDSIATVTSDYQAADADIRDFIGQIQSQIETAYQAADQELRSDYADGDAHTLTDSKAYTDSKVAAIPAVDTSPFLKKDGSVTLTGDLDLGSHKIKNVGEPTSDQDVTSKHYVDVANAALQNAINAFAMKLAWRPQVRAATGDAKLVNAADGTALSTLLPFSDDDAPAMTVNNFFAGDFIFLKNGPSSKMFVVIDDGGTLKVTTQNVKPLAEGDTFLVLNDLPDSPAAQEGAAIYAFGSDVVKVGDMDWSLATGIDLSPSFAAVAGTVTAGESVEGAISKLVANLAAEAATREQYDNAIVAAIESARTYAISEGANQAYQQMTPYVDSKITQEVSDRNAAIATASQDAHQYADTKAQQAQIAAQNYANSQLAANQPTTDGQGLQTNSNQLSLTLDGNTLAKSSAGLKVSQYGITPNELKRTVAGSGLSGGGGDALTVRTGDGVRLDTDGNVAADYTITLSNPNSFTLTKGQIIYLAPNGTIGLAIATDSNLSNYRMGVVAADAAPNANLRIIIRTGAIIKAGSGLQIGQKVYVARDTAGNLTQDLSAFQSGDQVERVGYAVMADAYMLDSAHEIEL